MGACLGQSCGFRGVQRHGSAMVRQSPLVTAPLTCGCRLRWLREGAPAVASLPQHTLRLLLAEGNHWGMSALAADCAAALGAPGATDEGAARRGVAVSMRSQPPASICTATWLRPCASSPPAYVPRARVPRRGGAGVAARGDGDRDCAGTPQPVHSRSQVAPGCPQCPPLACRRASGRHHSSRCAASVARELL